MAFLECYAQLMDKIIGALRIAGFKQISTNACAGTRQLVLQKRATLNLVIELNKSNR